MITVLSENEYEKILRPRDMNGHKYSFGVAGLVCGSKQYQGAACFATSSALHCGVGLSVAFIPDCIYIPFASKVSGAVIEALDCKDGMICDKSLPLRIKSRKCNALLCGSGLGLSKQSYDTFYSVCQLDLPLVIDGDGLFMARDMSVFERTAETVITPHIGEFSKLTGYNAEHIRNNRTEIAFEFAKSNGCTVVLKDYITVIADPSGDVYTFENPVSALAKGGSGDVLAGMIVSFIVQGYSALQASKIAVTLHNACGHKCEKQYGEYYTQPKNIINSIAGLI
jgi:NAD(P)H-hydrate epimerase